MKINCKCPQCAKEFEQEDDSTHVRFSGISGLVSFIVIGLLALKGLVSFFS